MNIRLHNTLTRRKDVFRPLHSKGVGIYTCGPTVYDFAHIGNLRSYIFADNLVRTLKLVGYRVKWVMNITDIDDKTIAAAARAKTTLKAYTVKFTNIFLEDLKLLNIKPANAYPRATDHLKEMRAIVRKLEVKGLAYRTEDGVYFDISKFRGYGKLSGLKKRELMPGARVAVDAYDKQSPADFALWKIQRTDNPSSVFRPPSSGSGRPGWHLECSAMSRKYLGQPFDIHTGGVDLIFPHHENEIAQSTGAFGVPLANYFLHNEHLLLDGKKMAKSEGNFYALRDVIDRGFDPLALRYLFLSVHYREKINFTWESLTAAEEALRRVRQVVQRKSQIQNPNFQKNHKSQTPKIKTEIEQALADDLNIPKAIALLHTANDGALWLHFDSVLGLNLRPAVVKLTAPQRRLVKRRESLRKAGKFTQADHIRRQLAKQGIVLEDTPGGVRLIR